MILVCIEDARRIRNDPATNSPEALRALKVAHEEWVQDFIHLTGSDLVTGLPKVPADHLVDSHPNEALGEFLGRTGRISVYSSGNWESRAELEKIVEIAQRPDGMIISPSDGGYGVNVDPADEAKVATIRRLVNRPGSSSLPDARDPIPVVFDSVERVREWTLVTKHQARVLSEFWPGPLTLFAEARHVSALRAARILSGGSTFAVRQTGSVIERALVRHAGRALTSMAIRDSLGRPVRRADDAIAILSEAIARERIEVTVVVIADDRFLFSDQSTVLQLGFADQEVRLIREGCISYTALRDRLR